MTAQRDEAWLQSAAPGDITKAYAAGELEALLGRRVPSVPDGDSQLTTEHLATATPAEIAAAYRAGRTNELLGAPAPPPAAPPPATEPAAPPAPTYPGPTYVPPGWMPTTVAGDPPAGQG